MPDEKGGLVEAIQRGSSPWSRNRTGEDRKREPRPLEWTLPWTLPWTLSWDVSCELSLRVLEGLSVTHSSNLMMVLVAMVSTGIGWLACAPNAERGGLEKRGCFFSHWQP